MAISVNTNIASLVAQTNLASSTKAMNQAMERMTTGFKINSAKDDAAGLAIATSFNTQIRGSKVANNNIQEGINLMQTTEGALSSMEDNLNRIRDLAVQGANETNSAESRKAIEKEVTARMAEIDSTADAARFNGLELLSDNAPTSITLQVGANSTDSLEMTGVFEKAHCTSIGLTSTAAAAFVDADTSRAFIKEVDAALAEVASRRSDIGAYTNRLESKLDNINVTIQNATAAKGTIMDADIATESASFVNSQILQQTSSSLLATANQTPSIALSLI